MQKTYINMLSSDLRRWGTKDDRDLGTGGAYCATIVVQYLDCSLSGWTSNWKRMEPLATRNW
jgi:hypothetical protein